MNEFSNTEMAVMHYVYGAADRNERVAARTYLKHFSNKRQQRHVLFGQFHRRLREYGALEVRNHISLECTTRTPVVEETVLQKFVINKQTNLCASECVLGVGRSTIMHILHEYHTYHFQKI